MVLKKRVERGREGREGRRATHARARRPITEN